MKPMLAVEAKDLKFPLYASVKLDGVRAVIKDGVLLSRSLKPIPNEYVQTMLGHSEMDGLDGELTVGPANANDLMQRTTSGVMSQEGQPDFVYWVFDFWNNPTMPFGERFTIMQRALKDGVFAGQTRVQLLPQYLIHTQAELESFETYNLEQGYEGTMVRSPMGVYKYGRSTAKEGYLLKRKPWVDAEAVVIGFEEGLHNANEATLDELGHTKRSTHQANMIPKDTLGALLVRGPDGTEFRVSPGCMTHPQRKAVWDDRASFMGRLLTYKTFKQTGVKDKPRFNVFKAWRDTRDIS